jgi:hypothetical protein
MARSTNRKNRVLRAHDLDYLAVPETLSLPQTKNC